MRTIVFLLSLFSSGAYSQFGLTGQLFQLEGQQQVNNAKLAWDITSTSVPPFQVQRSTSGGTFSTIATVLGNSYDDYGLNVQTAYTYRVAGFSSTSSTLALTPFTSVSSYSSYDNTQVSNLTVKSQIELNGVYYRYNYVTGSNSEFYIQQQTSSDGYTFQGNVSVLTSETICASINTTCHLERISFIQHPTTNVVVMWAHLENTVDYSLAQVACAYGTPGQSFTFVGSYRPLGHDSRDLTFWVDDEDSGYTGYLISATNVNSNMNIYQLTSNWTAIEKLANEVLISQYREAPSMVKVNGYYYLFTSRAAGWYPSEPFLIWTTNISSSWSNPIVPSEDSTYATQSGGIINIGESYAMMSNRWSANWSPTDGPNRDLMLPLSLSQSSNDPNGRYHFYKTVSYGREDSSTTQKIVGIQAGKILSLSKTLSVTPSGGTNLSVANDGVDNNPSSYFVPSAVPFTLTVDLGALHTVTQVDLATRMIQGSETYYQYTVIGSTDNKTYTTIDNQETNTAVGFSPSFISGSYRYIGVNVTRIINTHNGNEADYFSGVREFTVYGS